MKARYLYTPTENTPDVELTCCPTMENQLTYSCTQHPGQGNCPDVVVVPSTRGLMLRAINAEFAFGFCPWCGTELPAGLKVAKEQHV